MGQEYPLGEYIDFLFNGKWASSFNLVRICLSNRNSDKLIPTLKDRTVDIPGRDGLYYFGSNYDKKLFTFDFTFDSLTRELIEEVKAWLGDKKVYLLILSEDLYTSIEPLISYNFLNYESNSITSITTNGTVYKTIDDFFLKYGPGQYTCEHLENSFYRLKTPKGNDLDSMSLEYEGITIAYTPSVEYEDPNIIFGYINVEFSYPLVPKKIYSAKVTSLSILKYIPFDNIPNAEGGDLYKGEGSVLFTCYYPFARLPDIEEEAKVSNINSFIEETSIVVNSYIEYTSSEDINSGITLTGTEVTNTSKAPAPWTFRIGLSNDIEGDPLKTLTLMINSTEYALNLDKEADFKSGSRGDYGFVSYKKGLKTYLELNSHNNSIIFYKDGKILYLKSRNNSSTKMPKLYNRILTSTTELKPIPVGNFLLDLKSNNNEITGLFTYTPIVY